MVMAEDLHAIALKKINERKEKERQEIKEWVKKYRTTYVDIELLNAAREGEVTHLFNILEDPAYQVELSKSLKADGFGVSEYSNTQFRVNW